MSSNESLPQPDFLSLALAVTEGKCRAIDYQFAKFVSQARSGTELNLEPHSASSSSANSDNNSSLVFWTAYLLSKAQGDNHVCLNLARLAQRSQQVYPGGPLLTFPAWDEWRRVLLGSDVVALAGAETAAPLILDDERCYLARYWRYEQQVANLLLKKIQAGAQAGLSPAKQGVLKAALAQLFPEPPLANEPDWQKIACAMAARQKLSVITGGPGTGKTTTVIRLLALILLLAEQGNNLVLRLVAPTGKAAVRMTESIRNAKQALALTDELKALIPEQASTIHRLLGTIPGSVDFRYDQSHLLNVDLLVLDEASMVDLPLMAKLLSALPASCQLILLGDKDQLSSVEAGSILADLCSSISQVNGKITMNYSRAAASELSHLCDSELSTHIAADNNSAIADCICMLQKSYRFAGGIGELAQAVNRRHSQQALALLMDESRTDIRLHEQTVQAALLKLAVQHYGQFMQGLQGPAEQVIRAFDLFRVLCATRKGSMGTAELNKKIEQGLAQAGFQTRDREFYPGRPVMVSRNDYNVRLFNGDTGIVLPSAECGGELRVFFLQPDNSVRAVLPSRLPPHATAFAMTIHKSQGSEFAHVALALAAEPAFAPLMSKEVVYTGITRAKARVDIFSDNSVLKNAIQQQTQRQSGLKERLLALQS